jgi:hypothetical protein
MKRVVTMITFIALTGGISAHAADERRRSSRSESSTEDRSVVAEVDKQLNTINRMDDSPTVRRAGQAAVSKETAVPLPTVEETLRKHPTIGIAGLFMAHHLSLQTGKPVEQFVRARRDRSWSQIARANGADLENISDKLARIESAMRNPHDIPGTASRDSNRESVRERDSDDARESRRDRESRRERESSRTELERRLSSLNSLDDEPSAQRAGLMALSKETAVPYPQIEELHKQHTSASVGDLFIAQELATKTQKSASEFLSKKNAGKSWSEIISDNNQNRSEIEQKLSRIEQAMRDAK